MKQISSPWVAACARNVFPLVSPLGLLLLATCADLPVHAAGLQILRGHVQPVFKSLAPTGHLAATNRLNLAISLPLRNSAGLSNLLHQIYDPASPNYHHYLTPAQFTGKFGPSEQDYQVLIAFAQANHLQVTATHPNRLLLDVSGSVPDVETAMHVELHTYQQPTEKRVFFALDREPSLSLDVPVLHISGLDNYARPRPHLRTKPLSTRTKTLPNAGSGPSGTYMGPDFRAAYVPDTALDGSGQVVGLLQFDGYTASDITYYESTAGLPNVPLQNVLLDGFDGNPTYNGGEVEVSMDIEMVISMATNLSQVIVYEAGPTGDWHDILNRMANDNLAKQLSCSWFISGGGADATADGIFLQMAAQGQSFFNASGDHDAYPGLIDFPSDSPYITQVGGTTLTTSGPGGVLISETVWNWGIEFAPNDDGMGSGGGISTQYSIPDWQTNVDMSANQGSMAMRNVPDVAMTADHVYVRADGTDLGGSGTSCAAPLWAGFAALVNQQAANGGQPPIGFINPAVYAIGSGTNYSATFHDITTDNNTWSGSPTLFYATAGYDLCTGWGTPAGQSLINALSPLGALFITPATGFSAVGGMHGPFSVATQTFSLTNLGTEALRWTLSNTSVWLTVSSSGGTLTPAGPAASVTVSLDNTASNLPVGTYNATIWFTNQNENTAQSRQFTLSVISPPNITQQPASQAVLEGATAVFNVQAEGGMPLFYQWQFNGTNLTDGGDISGSSTSNLTVTGSFAPNTGIYKVVVTNYAGMARSSNASLTITPSRPFITTQPASQTVVVGSTVQFAVGVIGTTPMSYQWSFNGIDLSDATNAVLRLPGVQLGQAGNYSVTVSNIYGATNSAVAILAVNSAQVTMFFDDFTGPNLDPIWQPTLPNAHSGSSGGSDIPTYLGAPNFDFEMLGTNTVLHVTNLMSPEQRVGWSAATNFPGTNFFYDLRYNTLTQSQTTSIDGFIEIWIFDPADNSRYDIISPFGGGYDSDPYFFAGSSIDNSFATTSFHYQNNTWYHLVLQSAPGQNMRGSIYDDNGTELIGHTFAHDVSAYPSGFMIALSQSVGNSLAPYPVDVAVDYVAVISSFPPKITGQPTNQVVVSGGSANFAVTASGSVPLNYQWNYNGVNILGATNAGLSLINVLTNQAGNYAVQVSNDYGAISSSNAALFVGFQPVITTQPTAQTVAAGGTATFSAVVGGSSPLSFQWRSNGVTITGATNLSLSLTNVQFGQSGNYTLVATNIFGSVTSTNAALTVLAPPFITAQPKGQSVPVGSVAIFSAAASGTPPLVYQWTFNTTNLPGATTNTLTLTNVQLSQGGNYALIVSNAYGFSISSNALLTVYPVPPFITTQPSNQTITLGGTAAFAVVAGGTPPLAYQWSVNNTNISSATNATLLLSNVQFAQAGSCRVAITSPYGTTNSSAALLTVNAPLATYFFDDFSGPSLNPIWQAGLPTAHSGGSAGQQNTPYLGAPNFHFETLGTNSVLHLTNFMGPVQRRGWSSTTNFVGTNFYYDLRFNTLTQSPTTSIDGFVEIWIMDAANTNRYDIISPFEGGYSGDPYFFMGSSIDSSFSRASYTFQNNTWYHLVLQSAPGQNMRGSVFSDSGTELVGHTFAHSASTYGSGFKIAISQAVGGSGAAYPINADVDYVRVSGFPPAIICQPTNQTAPLGGMASFTVGAGGVMPLSYQWQFGGTNIIGATNPVLTLASVQLTNGGYYSVTVTNQYGSVTSSNALLTVLGAPVILAQPMNLTVNVGGTAVFAAVVSGYSPLSYQWGFMITNSLAGATNTSLTISNVQLASAGVYNLTVTNIYGSATSSNAVLTVVDTVDHFAWSNIPSPRFINAPFAVTIQARDAVNQLFTNFSGSVALSATNGGVAVNPSISGSFVQGTWFGSLMVPQTTSNLVLQASDGAGHVGVANPVNVVVPPSLTQARSGGSLLIYWAVDPAGFVLESATNLTQPNWQPVTPAPFQIGNQYLEPVPIGNTNQYFRLRFTLP